MGGGLTPTTPQIQTIIYSLMSTSQLCYPKEGEGEGGQGEEVAQGKGKRKGKEEGKERKGRGRARGRKGNEGTVLIHPPPPDRPHLMRQLVIK